MTSVVDPCSPLSLAGSAAMWLAPIGLGNAAGVPVYPRGTQGAIYRFHRAYPIGLWEIITNTLYNAVTKRLDCPLEGCHATIEAETEQDVMAQAEDHAGSAHPELDLDEATVESIRSIIKDV